MIEPRAFLKTVRYAYLDNIWPGYQVAKAELRQMRRYQIEVLGFTEVDRASGPSRRDGAHDLRAFRSDDEARSGFDEIVVGDGLDAGTQRPGGRRSAHPKRTWYVGGENSPVERLALQRVELWERRREAHAELTRRMVVRRAFGWPLNEIAAIEGVSVAAVASRLARYRSTTHEEEWEEMNQSKPAAISGALPHTRYGKAWRSRRATRVAAPSQTIYECTATNQSGFGALPSRDNSPGDPAADVVLFSSLTDRKERAAPNGSNSDAGDVAA